MCALPPTIASTLCQRLPRDIFLVFIGGVIAQLLIMTGDRFYGHEYRAGALFLALASALALGFFRKRKIALAISALAWVLVNAGLTVPFHSGLLAYALTVGSAAGLHIITRLSYKRYPYLAYKQMHTVFEGEAARTIGVQRDSRRASSHCTKVSLEFKSTSRA
jgi:hypothetical protein